MAADEYDLEVERPEAGQLLFPTPNKNAAGWIGGMLVLLAIFLAWLYFTPGSQFRASAGKLGFAVVELMVLAAAALNFYLLLVGRSFLIDGKTKLVSKNGERLSGFGGVRCVDLAVGFNPAIYAAGRSYALSLRLKSGESVAILGFRWRRWYEFNDDDNSTDTNDEDAAVRLDEIADEVAALIGVSVAKAAR